MTTTKHGHRCSRLAFGKIRFSGHEYYRTLFVYLMRSYCNNNKFHDSKITLQDRSKVFKCGLSTAPPTNWLFYDSMYTERYMGLPTLEDNLIGYEEGSLLDKVDKLRGKKFQVNHGVADDNVSKKFIQFD